LIAGGASIWEVAEDLEIIFDLLNQARGCFFRGFGGDVGPNLNEVAFSGFC
jgi:hypothetical protein